MGSIGGTKYEENKSKLIPRSSEHPAFLQNDLPISQLAIPPLPRLPEGTPDGQMAVFLTLWDTTADVHVLSSSASTARKQGLIHGMIR